MVAQIIDDLTEFFVDDMTTREVLTRDMKGRPLTWSDPVVYKVRIGGQHKVVRDEAGQERVSTLQAWVMGAPGLTIEHEYTLPSRFTPPAPPALSVSQFSDENGPHHEVVYFA